MNKNDKIYVAGHCGLVGSALFRYLESDGFCNVVSRPHRDLDLTDAASVREFFDLERPQHVFLAAARVGGILANASYSAEFIRENLLIQTNVIHEAWRHGVERLLFLGSSCIYPRDCPQPIREEYLMTGPLEWTNSAYAVAKIAGVEMCHAYNRQHRTRFLCVMPCNLYGPGDNFDLQNSHVLAALMRKFHEGRLFGSPVVLWGSGEPRREFLHVDDMAEACLHIMNLPDQSLKNIFSEQTLPLINVGCGEDLSIKELAKMVAEIVGHKGEPQWDRSKPDGTPRKVLDISRLRSLGWEPGIGLREGISNMYEWFQESQSVKQ